MRGPACARRGVDGRKVQLRVGRPQGIEQVEDRFVHGLGPGVRAIHLADRDDRPQADPERLVHDELGLRHGTLCRIHQDEHAVDHSEHPFHLAAEIRVAGGVNDVDAHAAPVDRRTLRQDRDAALALNFTAVQRALPHGLVCPHGAALAQQTVDQGRLAVVDMCDDGDVAEVPGVLLLRVFDRTDM